MIRTNWDIFNPLMLFSVECVLGEEKVFSPDVCAADVAHRVQTFWRWCKKFTATCATTPLS